MWCPLIIEKLMRLEEGVAGNPAVKEEAGNSEGSAPAIQSVKCAQRCQKPGGGKLRAKVKSKIR